MSITTVQSANVSGVNCLITAGNLTKPTFLEQNFNVGEITEETLEVLSHLSKNECFKDAIANFIDKVSLSKSLIQRGKVVFYKDPAPVPGCNTEDEQVITKYTLPTPEYTTVGELATENIMNFFANYCDELKTNLEKIKIMYPYYQYIHPITGADHPYATIIIVPHFKSPTIVELQFWGYTKKYEGKTTKNHFFTATCNKI
jgi:hypothetical protein